MVCGLSLHLMLACSQERFSYDIRIGIVLSSSGVIVHHVSQHFGIQRDIDAALNDSWAMLEIINRLVFREKPWYLSDEPLALKTG